MMPLLVWGAPGLPETRGDHQGVDLLKVRKARFLASLLACLTVLSIAAMSGPVALGATRYELRFVTGRQPQDAEVGETIKAADLNDAAAFVQVEVVDASGTRATTVKSTVGFTLKSGTGFASGSGLLSVLPQPLVNGVATFGEGTLSIAKENEPQFTDYALVPRTTKGAQIIGPQSDGFDIWEDGESCTGVLDDPNRICEASLRGGGAEGEDTYTLDAAGTLGASELTSGELPGLDCAGQREIFANAVFSYATTGSNTPVFLENHITRADWRASANNGQAHADWCIGLPTASPWIANGANYSQLDTDLDGSLDLYVALAPRCPVANPSGSAPCIVSQNPDGDGGSITLGWLTAGDPPRRT
jgi:hypothetical protein